MGLIFDGVDIESTYGIIVDGADTWTKPARDRELVHVPGRSGDLIYDNGSWTNVTLTYHCHIHSSFADRFEAFCDWVYSLFGYHRFEDQQRHPGVYRMVEFAGPIDPKTIFRDEIGNFDLVLNAKPQQWLESGEDEVSLTYETWVDGFWFRFDIGQGPAWVFDNTGGAISGIATPRFDITRTDLEKPWLVLRATYPGTLEDAENFTGIIALAYLNENMEAIGVDYAVGYDFIFDEDPSNSMVYMYRYIINGTTDYPSGTKYIQMSIGTSGGIAGMEVAYALVEYEEAIHHYVPVEAADYYGSDAIDPREWSVYTEHSEFILNETNYTARPIIEIDAPSGVNFIINNFTVAIEETDIDTLVIDCELEDCYSYDENGEVVNQNGIVSISCSDDRELSDFPYIVPGENYFKALLNEETARAGSEIVASIRMKPNWYRI